MATKHTTLKTKKYRTLKLNTLYGCGFGFERRELNGFI